MSIFKRFGDIMSSNVNAVLDKMEDPSKMVDQMLRNAMKDMAEVKKETAGVMAEEKRCKRILEKAQADANKYDDLARKAVQAGNDNDATVFLQEKSKLTAELQQAQATYQAASDNATKMRQMHDKLANDINELKRRKNSVQATMAVAKTQSRVNKMNSGKNSQAALDGFSKYEERANNMLDRANAEAELNEVPESEADRLAAQYASSGADVSGELAALKASMGMAPAADVSSELADLKAQYEE